MVQSWALVQVESFWVDRDARDSYSLLGADSIRDGIFWDHPVCGCLVARMSNLERIAESVVPPFVVSEI